MKSKTCDKLLDELNKLNKIIFKLYPNIEAEDFLDLTDSYSRLKKLSEKVIKMYYYQKNRNKRVPISSYKKNLVAHRDNYTCKKCGKYMMLDGGIEIDHIVPVSRGGTDKMDNLQVLCKKCNLKKLNSVGCDFNDIG